MDYILECLQDTYMSEKYSNELLLEQMERESTFIFTCIENNIINEEDYQVLNEGFLANVLESIKAFFSKIFASFKEKANQLFKTDETWLKENWSNFDTINYSGLEVTVANLWESSIDKTIKPAINAIANKIDKNKIPADNILSQYSEDNDKMNAFILKDAKIIIQDQETMTDAIKRYFRTGDKPMKVTTIKGGNLKGYCTNDFRNYCINYKKVAVSYVENEMTNIVSKLDKLESAVTKEAHYNDNIMDKYSILEETTFNNTDLIFCSNASPLLEEKGLSEKQKAAISEADKKKLAEIRERNTATVKDDAENSLKPTKVEVTDTNKEDGENSQNGEKDVNEYDGVTSNQQAYLRSVANINKTMVSCAMTVLEEKYNVYMKILKQVVLARSKDLSEKKRNENKVIDKGENIVSKKLNKPGKTKWNPNDK